ncbi:MAG TPA: ubiquinol-cytochrome c reductase iron-sulfur subunit [Gemmatimonadaceae bacterium]
MACDDCVSRRAFLATSALAVVAAATGCGNGQIGPDAVAGLGNGTLTIKVGDFPDLAVTGTLVSVSNVVAAKRTDTAAFAAYSMVCTHQGCLTSLQSNSFFCPCHGSMFDSGGRVTRGPATTALPQFATSYDAVSDQLTIG